MTEHRVVGEGNHWAGWPSCPCDISCGVESLKLNRAGHAVGCKCRPCTGRRSQRKGKAAQAKTHRNLGGTGFTPSNEESARPYILEVIVMPEVKTGGQIPKNWDTFVKSDWFRRALGQSERSRPTGSGALPSVSIRGDFLIIDIRKRGGAKRPTD